MGFKIIRSDISEMAVDAIVNTANRDPRPGYGTDTAVFKKAGSRLLEARRKIGVLRPGDIAITPGFRLPAKYVIHAVFVPWRGGDYGEPEIMRRCYQNALQCALEHHCHTLAFPLMGAGNYRFPRETAMKIAVKECADFLIDHPEANMTIYLVVFDPASSRLAQALIGKFPQMLDEYEVQRRALLEYELSSFVHHGFLPPAGSGSSDGPDSVPRKPLSDLLQMDRQEKSEGNVPLMNALSTFMSAKGIGPAELYNQIGMHRQTFFQVYADGKTPRKDTLRKIAIGLHLDYEEAKYLFSQAGYALNKNDPVDEIMITCFRNHIYDLAEIDDVLYKEVGKTYFSL